MKSLFFDVSIPRILATKILSKVYPGIYYSPISPVRYKKLPDPGLPGPNWVRVETIAAGICGTDLGMFYVQASPAISIAALPSMPRVFLGHEAVGRVVEKGGGATDFDVGDRVILQKYLACCSIIEMDPPCNYCREGNYTLCTNFSRGSLPKNLGAGFGDQFVAHKTQLLKVPDDMTDDAAVLVEPAAVGVHAVLKRKPEKGEAVLIVGAGTVGLMVIQAAKAIEPGCRIYLMETMAFKRELGLSLGADEVLDGDPYEAVSKATGAFLYRGPLKNTTMLGGFDLVYDCVGHTDTIHHCLRWLKAGGDYVMVGNQLYPMTFDHTPVWQQELRIIGVNAHGQEDFQGKKQSSFEMAMEMIRDGRIRVAGFITHRFPMEAYRSAFGKYRDKKENTIKVVLENRGNQSYGA